MKNITQHSIKLVLIGALSFGLTGCKDFLDLKPLDNRVEQNFFKTESDANEALTSVYDVLQWHTNAGGGGFSPDPLLSDIASDDSFAGGGSRSDAPEMIHIDQHKISPTNSLIRTYWSNHYNGIYRANLLISKLPGINASDDFKKKVLAEAKFLRAFFYLDLVRSFENIPLILAPQNPSEYCQPQATPKQTFTQIVTDLEEAIPDLANSTLRDNKAHATKWAAKALLARAYLFYKGVYNDELTAGDKTINAQAALNHLKDIINTSGHDLLDNYEDIFKRSNEFSVESVWEISYSNDNPWWDWNYIQGGEGNMQPLQQGPRIADDPNYNTGWSFAPVTLSLVNAFEANDPRKEATILFQETELTGSVTTGYQHTGYYSQKYTTTKEYTPALGQYELNWGNNYRSIRFADVLLMAAELDLMAGEGNAQNYFTRVRDRVNMPFKAVSIDNIFLERRVELALEGIRYWDLLRRGQTAASQAITIQNVRGPGYTDDQADYNITYNSATKGFYPIPQSEIDLCGGILSKNDGY
jgi:hypothetical protein